MPVVNVDEETMKMIRFVGIKLDVSMAKAVKIVVDDVIKNGIRYERIIKPNCDGLVSPDGMNQHSE
jgi:hypothetical protein